MENADFLNEKNINSYMFLDYIKSFGLKLENYEYILELFQEPKGSISQFIKNNKQFLLSNLVSYKSLNEVGIKGGCGYFTTSRIVIPKTLKNDDIFLHNKTLSNYHKLEYNVPKLEDFDVIIGNGISKNIVSLAKLPIDKYVGFCIGIDDKNKRTMLEEYKKLICALEFRDNNYVLEHDTKGDKELCLIRKK